MVYCVLASSHDFSVADEGFDLVGCVLGEAVEDGVGHKLVVVFLGDGTCTE